MSHTRSDKPPPGTERPAEQQRSPGARGPREGRATLPSRGSFGHGKVILLGEHSVVYGRPALAAGLSLGARAVATRAAVAELSVAPWGVSLGLDDDGQGAHGGLRQAFAALLAGYDEPPGVAVKVELELPGSAGLGASAALSVAVVRAIDEVLGLRRDDLEIARHAFEAERVFHGNPSGIDNTMAACGGLSLYRKGEGIVPVQSKTRLKLVVGHSGQPGRTKETVASVARQRDSDPNKVDAIFDGIEAAVHNGRTALERGEIERFGQLMELNHRLLVALMLSTTRLEELCNAARRAGALGAKLTGGGGGGCMIALSRDDEGAQRICDALRAEGADCFIAEAG